MDATAATTTHVEKVTPETKKEVCSIAHCQSALENSGWQGSTKSSRWLRRLLETEGRVLLHWSGLVAKYLVTGRLCPGVDRRLEDHLLEDEDKDQALAIRGDNPAWFSAMSGETFYHAVMLCCAFWRHPRGQRLCSVFGSHLFFIIWSLLLTE